MADAVYHRLTDNDLFSTTVMTWPSVVIWKDDGDAWHGNMNGLSGSLSLYGGIRQRFDVFSGSTSGLQVYPLDDVDTHSIDKVIQVAGQYPATGTINFVYCTNDEAPDISNITDTRWYEEHYRPIELLYNWHNNYKSTYVLDTASLPGLYLFHIPSMYYDRQISPKTVNFIDWTYSGSVGQHFFDDGRGSLMLSSSTGDHEKWGNVFYVEGLIVFTKVGYVPGNGAYDSGDLYGYDQRKMQLEFSGSHPIVTKTFMCRMQQSNCNCSHNTTWSAENDNGNLVRVNPTNDVYITSVAIYNEDYEVVAVAKLAQPILKREVDSLNIRLRMDF